MQNQQPSQYADPFELGPEPHTSKEQIKGHVESFELERSVVSREGDPDYASHRQTGSLELPKKCVIPRAPRRNFCLARHKPLLSGVVDGNSQRGLFNTHGMATERVELQIEGLSPLVGRGMLIIWYAVLLVAVVVESLIFVSWGLMDICGEDVDDLRDYNRWNSSCVTDLDEKRIEGLHIVRWEGGPYSTDIYDELVRFPNIVLSLATPDDWDNSNESKRIYNLRALIPYPLDNESLPTLSIVVTCVRSQPRCEFAELPPMAVLNSTGKGKMSLTLLDLPPSLARGIKKSSIGILFMKRNYSLGVLIWRYTLLVLSILHLIRFIVYKKFTSMLYEQIWVVALQLLLIWYLNPFLAVSLWRRRSSLMLVFLEVDIPTWFAAVFVGFMLSAITASMPWTPPPRGQKPVYDLSTLHGIKGFLCYSSSIYDPPRWTKCLVMLFIIVIIALDFIGMIFYSLPTSGLWMKWSLTIYFTVSVLLIVGSLICAGLLFHLHRNMGLKSYLDSRPQHLACRVFIFVFLTAILYYIFHFIIFFLRYKTIPGMLTSQPLMQLPAYMVASFFVNIMTLIYTRRDRGDLVPIHPRDERWKCMVWPDSWYRWLSRHGGSMYIFHTEEEEVNFNWNQYEFRMRQHKARLKRRNLRRSAPLRHRNATAEEASHNLQYQQAGNIVSVKTTEADNNALSSHAGMASPTTVSNDDTKVINMDKTSSWFLPVQPRRTMTELGPHTIRCRSHPIGEVQNETTSVATHLSSKVPRDTSISLSHASPLPVILQPTRPPNYLSPRDATTGPFEETGGLSMTQRYYLECFLDGGGNDGNFDGDRSVVTRTLGRAREKLGSFIKTAERNFISKPIHAFAHFETSVLDAVVRPFQNVEYLPFFNLETAIDCFNLSWEAYGIPEEVEVEFGKRRPFSLLHSCCYCCCAFSSISSCSDDLSMEVTEGSGTGCSGKVRNNETGEDRQQTALPINVKQYGYRLCAVLEAMDVQIILCTLDSEKAKREGKAPRVVIAFRGTNSISNAWQDLRVRREVWDEMVEGDGTVNRSIWCGWKPTVHVGFLSIWKALRDVIHSKLWGLLSADPSTVYRVFCTGHSLGGALASLCAYSVSKMLNKRKYPLSEVTVYTYGQPPLGNKAFQSKYNKAVPRTFRVVNESDVVSLIRMYGHHVGIEVNIDRYGNYICKPTFMERLFRPTKGRGFAVENHLLEKYSASLNAIAKNTSCRAVAFAGEEINENHIDNDAARE